MSILVRRIKPDTIDLDYLEMTDTSGSSKTCGWNC